MSKSKIYSVYDKGKYIGSYTPEVAEMVIGIPRNQVNKYAVEEQKYQERYCFEPEIDKQRNGRIGKKLADDWDFTTRFFLMAAERRAKCDSR